MFYCRLRCMEIAWRDSTRTFQCAYSQGNTYQMSTMAHVQVPRQNSQVCNSNVLAPKLFAVNFEVKFKLANHLLDTYQQFCIKLHDPMYWIYFNNHHLLRYTCLLVDRKYQNVDPKINTCSGHPSLSSHLTWQMIYHLCWIVVLVGTQLLLLIRFSHLTACLVCKQQHVYPFTPECNSPNKVIFENYEMRIAHLYYISYFVYSTILLLNRWISLDTYLYIL